MFWFLGTFGYVNIKVVIKYLFLIVLFKHNTNSFLRTKTNQDNFAIYNIDLFSLRQVLQINLIFYFLQTHETGFIFQMIICLLISAASFKSLVK